MPTKPMQMDLFWAIGFARKRCLEKGDEVAAAILDECRTAIQDLQIQRDVYFNECQHQKADIDRLRKIIEDLQESAVERGEYEE